MIHDLDRHLNPFATRYVRPGAIPWIELTADGNVVPASDRYFDSLCERYITVCQQRAAIVGPHGTGKSTLLEHLVPRLGQVVHRSQTSSSNGDNYWLSIDPRKEHQFAPEIPARQRSRRPIVWLSLRRDLRPLRGWLNTRKWWTKSSLLVIDGFEQLSAPGRWLVLAVNRLRHAGVLLTSHRPTALTTLCWTESSVAGLQATIRIAFRNAGLTGAEDYMDANWLRELLAQEQGNVRETLMRLYDHYARRSAH